MCNWLVYKMVLHYKLFHCFFSLWSIWVIGGGGAHVWYVLCMSTHVYVCSGIRVGLQLMSLAFLSHTPLSLEVQSLV